MRGERTGVTQSPYAQRIVAQLEERIRSGAYPNGQWLPTERSLAEEFDVSRAVVRSALDELERRSLVARAAGCRPLVRYERRKEARPAVGVRRNLALWITLRPGETDWNTIAVTRGVQRALNHNAFRLVMAGPVGDTLEAIIHSEAQQLARMAMDREIAGLILWYHGGETNRPVLERLRAANIPMVFIDRLPPAGFDADFVGVDETKAVREMVRHLLAQGHRRIAHITNPEQVSFVSNCLNSYRCTLEEAGIPFRPELVLTGEIQNVRAGEAADALAERLLSLPDPPTAVFAVTDYAALSLVAALKARGVRVPQDIAVAGCENLEQWMPGEPFLTTIHQPFERMGEEAVNLMVYRLENGPANTYRHLLLDAPLILRASTEG
jgi:LacI family transcriptional regulator